MKRIFSMLLAAALLASMLPFTAIFAAQPERSDFMTTVKSYVSDIDDDMKAEMQKILADGKTKGRKAGLMAQWGDSITHTHAYLAAWYESRNTLGKTEDGYNYVPILEWMAAGTGNLAQKGEEYANFSGWRCMTVLANMEPAVIRLNPSWALIMVGTNDLDKSKPADFEKKLRELMDRSISLGVIPTLSTIPPIEGERNDVVPAFNEAIIRVAKDYKVPYIDLWGLCMDIHPDDWATTLLDDGVHLTFTGAAGAISKDDTLKNNGYMLRSVLAAELAEVMRAVVFEDVPQEDDPIEELDPTPVAAIPTSATVLVNGTLVAFDAYNIGGNNYFKLRDLAFALNGSGKQFEVVWDGAANAIRLTSGQPYTVVGGEMTGKGEGEKMTKRTNSKVLLNGSEVKFTAYNIEDNNYFKLRDVGAALDFGVDWNNTTKTIAIDTSKGYTPEA